MTSYLKYLILFSVIVALGLPGQAHAQSVDEKLANIEQNLMKIADEKGFKLTKITRKERALGEGGEELKKLDDLPIALTYLAIGACDNDCSGLGLSIEQSVLLDGTSQTVVEDMSGKTAPSVEFFLNPFGDFKLKISMLSCSTLICDYGVDIYQVDKVQ